MNLPRILAGKRDSTSTPDAPSKGPGDGQPAPIGDPPPAGGSAPGPATPPLQCQVRRHGPRFNAKQVPDRREVELVDGSKVMAHPGDWLICAGTHVTALVFAKAFPGDYEVIVEGGLTLSKAEREILESQLGLGATRSGDALIAAVARIATLRLGGITLSFTPGQLEELQHRASKRGRTLEAELQDAVHRVEDEIFHGHSLTAHR